MDGSACDMTPEPLRSLPAPIKAVFPVFVPFHFLPGYTLVIGSQVGEFGWGLGLLNCPSCVFFNGMFT